MIAGTCYSLSFSAFVVFFFSFFFVFFFLSVPDSPLASGSPPVTLVAAAPHDISVDDATVYQREYLNWHLEAENQ